MHLVLFINVEYDYTYNVGFFFFLTKSRVQLPMDFRTLSNV